jgi:Zincin-like metallopeptidase
MRLDQRGSASPLPSASPERMVRTSRPPPGAVSPKPGTFAELSQPRALLDGYLRQGPGCGTWPATAPTTTGAPPLSGSPPRAVPHPEGYCATALHERGQSTGHQNRLAGSGIVTFDHYGSERYLKEELVAQMTVSILCVQTGIDNPGDLRQLRQLHFRLAPRAARRP